MMISTKTRSNSQQTRLHLLNSAREVFYQNGVSRASLQSIAEAAGVTRGALYWHFKGKEDILDELCQLYFSDFYANLTEEKLSNANALELLKQNLSLIFHRLHNDEPFRQFCIVLELKCEHTENNSLVSELLNKYHNLCDKHIMIALQYCVKQGHLSADTPLNLAVLYLKSCLTGLLRHCLLQPESPQILETAQSIINTALHTLIHQGMVKNSSL